MLDPEDRHLLLDALRPPEGYQLSFAIGTTYTLDLLALLTAPLGFTMFELAGPPAAELAVNDTVRLLSVLRHHADRIGIFCEAGRIAVPPRHAILFGELERMVVQVRPPEGKSFHPKLWVLRYERPEQPVCYRVLCMTRNLTFDRSWDTMLVLDGELRDRKVAYSVNHPLADFVAALPGLAIAEVPASIGDSVRTARDELRRVEWEFPPHFEAVAFWPLGIPGYKRSPFDEADRMLVLSPFLAGSTLDELRELSGKSILVSRTDALDLIARPSLSKWDKVYAFNSDVTTEQPQNDESTPLDPLGSAGLHAKLYVMERGWDAHVITGSANATSAAFSGNVEFLTELIGKKSKVGIDALLASQAGKTSLETVIQEYRLDLPVVPLDAALEKQKERLDQIRRAVASASWHAQIETEEGGSFRVTLSAESEPIPTDVRIDVRPVLLLASSTRQLETQADRMEVAFEHLSFEGLTSFYAFDVRLIGQEQAEPCRFVVNARLIGEPEGRRERITQYLLRDREQVVRFLLNLLANDAEDLGGSTEVGGQAPEGDGVQRFQTETGALLEPLLRALDRTPDRLDEVATVIDDLKKTEEGRAKLPPGIDAVWDAVWQVRQSMRKGAAS